MSSRHSSWIFLAIAALVAILLLWSHAKRPAEVTAANTAGEGGDVTRGGVVGGRGGRGAGDEARPVTNPASTRLEQALDDYKRVAIYPPWSRAHDEGTKYLLEWNKPVVSELPMSDDPASPTMYKFNADRHHVVFNEPLTTWIEVYPAGKPEQHLPLTVRSAFVMVTSGDGGRAVPLSYHDDGKDGDATAGDNVWSNRFVPAQQDSLKQGKSVQLQVDVEAGGMRKPMVRDFTYAPRPVLDVLGVSDAIKDGSLDVTLDVQVYDKGLFTFDANVMSGDGATPIGYTDLSYPLSPGRHKVELIFFGKIFTDAAIDGPYQIRDLRGFLRGDESVPGGEANIWWSDDRVYLTHAYKHDELSSAEWDAPEKQEKIKGFQSAIDASKPGHVADPNQPAHLHIGEDGVARPVP